MAEATPRVKARLAGLRGGIVAGPPAAFDAPAMAPAAAMAAAVAPAVALPAPAARRRSISSTLVPWAGARAAASHAAGVTVAHAYDLRSGEAALVRRAPMAVDADRWRSQEMRGPGGPTPVGPRWRMWRDASAALVAFALVGLVFVGGDLLRIPTGPLPPTPGLAVAVTQPSAAPTATAVAVATAPVLPDPPVLVTPSPAPIVVTVRPTPAATPPETGPTAKPTRRPTPKPTPRPTPSLDPAFYCDSYTPVALQTIHCQVVVANGGTVAYQWLASDDGTAYHAVSDGTGRTVSLSFAVPGFYYLEVGLTRGSTTVTSDPAAITVGLIP